MCINYMNFLIFDLVTVLLFQFFKYENFDGDSLYFSVVFAVWIGNHM